MSKWLLLALAACSVPPAEASWGSRSETPYSCDGLDVEPQVATVDPAIVVPWRRLAEATTHDVGWAIEIHKAAAKRMPATLTVDERVRLQHQLLAIAKQLDARRRHEPWLEVTHRRVMGLIRATAPTADELVALGASARPQVSAVLGDEIVERATESCGSGNLLHNHVFGGLLAFRPLRAGTTRALVAQLVAFDREGTPHITPLVDAIELRLGNDVSSPACVIQSRADGTLHAAEYWEVHEHPPFVQKRNDSGLGCVGCHPSSNSQGARDLSATETIAIDAGRDRQVHDLARSLWKSLSEPLRSPRQE